MAKQTSHTSTSTCKDIRPQYASARIGNEVFYIPFAYYYRVRLGTVGKLLSWMLIYLLPVFWYSYLATDSMSYVFVLNFMLILLSVFTLYETGYIHNDTFATMHEERPAIRLYEHNLTYFYSHWKQIFLIRILYADIALAAFLLVNGITVATALTTACILIVPFLFFVYNTWRQRYNVLLYPVLVFSRYIPFLLLYDAGWQLYLLMFLSFPCINMLERFSMPSYRFAFMKRILPDEDSKTLFRVLYYLVVTPVLLFFFSPFKLIPFFILGVYRISILVLLRFYRPRNYLQN